MMGDVHFHDFSGEAGSNSKVIKALVGVASKVGLLTCDDVRHLDDDFIDRWNQSFPLEKVLSVYSFRREEMPVLVELLSSFPAPLPVRRIGRRASLNIAQLQEVVTALVSKGMVVLAGDKLARKVSFTPQGKSACASMVYMLVKSTLHWASVQRAQEPCWYDVTDGSPSLVARRAGPYMKMETPHTSEVVKRIIIRDFKGTKILFAKQCRIDPADVSRVSKSSRPATFEFVGKAVNALDVSTGEEILKAYLLDILKAVAGPDWTIVKPPRLVRGVIKGKDYR